MAFHSKCQQRTVLRLKQMGLAESADALPVWGKTHLATEHHLHARGSMLGSQDLILLPLVSITLLTLK